MKKKIKIILTGFIVVLFIILLILYVRFYNGIVINTYDKAYFTVVEKTISDTDEVNMIAKLEEEGYERGTDEFIDEHTRRLKEHIKIRDYSEKGIVCENVWVIGRSGKLSKYVVVYDDRTVKYITGRFTTLTNFVTYTDLKEIVEKDNLSIDIANTIYVKDIREEKEIKLSRLKYFILLNKLKLIKLFKVDTVDKKEFPKQTTQDYAKGFYMDGICYRYERKNRPDFSYKFKMNIRLNCNDYINRCLGYSDKMMAS